MTYNRSIPYRVLYFKLKYMTQLWSVRCNLNNIVFDIKGGGSMVAKLILKVS